jgi:hypothetical protein
MISLNIPKKQHYVPQFLLRNFSKKKNRIYVFDKKLNRSFPCNVKDIGHENNFYEDQLLGYGNETELKLSKLETVVAPVIEKILIDGSIKNLEDWEHKFIICLFSTVQMIRTNDIRKFLEGFNQILNKRITEWGYDPNTEVKNYKTPSQAELKSSAIDLLNTLPSSLSGGFLNKQLSLLKAPKGQNFYISDHPIVIHNHFPREGRGNLGIGLKGIEIFFPISPVYCLSFLCGETAQEVITKVKNFKASQLLGIVPKVDMSEAEKMVDYFENGTTNKLAIENMDFSNSLQVIQSTRFVYSCEPKFNLAKDMLKTHPEISTQEKFVDGSTLF